MTTKLSRNLRYARCMLALVAQSLGIGVLGVACRGLSRHGMPGHVEGLGFQKFTAWTRSTSL